jgi:adenine-specific DNA methylase
MLFLRRQWITHLRMAEVLKDAADKIEQASILIAQAYDKIDEYAHENAPDRTPD